MHKDRRVLIAFVICIFSIIGVGTIGLSISNMDTSSSASSSIPPQDGANPYSVITLSEYIVSNGQFFNRLCTVTDYSKPEKKCNEWSDVTSTLNLPNTSTVRFASSYPNFKFKQLSSESYWFENKQYVYQILWGYGTTGGFKFWERTCSVSRNHGTVDCGSFSDITTTFRTKFDIAGDKPNFLNSVTMLQYGKLDKMSVFVYYVDRTDTLKYSQIDLKIGSQLNLSSTSSTTIELHSVYDYAFYAKNPYSSITFTSIDIEGNRNFVLQNLTLKINRETDDNQKSNYSSVSYRIGDNEQIENQIEIPRSFNINGFFEAYSFESIVNFVK